MVAKQEKLPPKMAVNIAGVPYKVGRGGDVFSEPVESDHYSGQ